MDAMRDALRSKRTGGMGLMKEESAEPAEGGGQDLAALVAALSPEQKQELLGLLQEEQGEGGEETAAADIEKGAPTSSEKAQINAKMGEKQDDEPSADTDELMVSDIGNARGGLFQRAAAAAKERLAQKGKKA